MERYVSIIGFAAQCAPNIQLAFLCIAGHRRAKEDTLRATNTATTTLKNTSSFVYAFVTIGGVDLTDRVLDIQVSTDIDSKGYECSITFKNDPSLPDLRPDSGSTLTNTLKPRKTVKIEALGTLTKGVRTGTRDLIFDGLTGDAVISSRDASKNDTVTVHCRGRRQKLLADTFITDERIYPVAARGTQVWLVGNPNASALAATVAQQILTDYAPGVTIFGTGPSFSIFPYRVMEISVWEAVQNVFIPTGFEVRERFQAGAFELVISDPLSVGGADTITTYQATSLDYTDANVRNKVRVYWRTRNRAADIAAGALVPPEGYEGILFLERSDATSITAHGERSMKIMEGETSHIDTYAEAFAFAGFILNDLKDVLPTDNVTHKGALYHLEPYDSLTLSGRQSGTLMITAIRFSIQPGGYAETTIEGVRKTVRANNRWIDLDSRTGDNLGDDNDLITGTAGQMPPERVTGLTLTSRFESVLAKWSEVTKYSNGKPIEARLRYKVYLKRSFSPGIPAINIGIATTYDEIINLDSNEAVLKVSQEASNSTSPEFIAMVVTALARNGREGIPSIQLEARSITNFGIGVESSSANALLHVRGNVAGNTGFVIESVINAAQSLSLDFLRSRGTYANVTPVLNGDELADIGFYGLDTVLNWCVGARLVVSVSGSVGNNILPTRWGFHTRGLTESFDTEKLAIEPSGHLNIKPLGSADGGGLTLHPWGTSAGNTGLLSFRELAINGTSSINFKAPDSLPVSLTFTWPSADGAAGQVLSTNGAGVLSFTTAGGTGAPVGAAYVVMSSNTTLTSERVLAVNASNLTLTDGGANANVTLNTIQDIGPGASPTFSRLSLSAFDTHAILFIGEASGLIAQDAFQLVWDNTTSRMGLGTRFPQVRLHIRSTALGEAAIRAENSAALGGGSGAYYQALTTLTPTTSAQKLGGFQWGSVFFANTAAIVAQSAQAFTATGVGTDIIFETASVNTLSRTEKMRLTANGLLGIGTSAVSALLHLDGSTALRASLRIEPGTTPTTLGNGDVWYDGAALLFRFGTQSIGLLGWNKAAGNTVLLSTPGDIVILGTGAVTGAKLQVFQNSSGMALYAESTITGATTQFGIQGIQKSNTGAGVYGEAFAGTATAFGVWGRSQVSGGIGVRGEAIGSGTAISGVNTNTAGRAGLFVGDVAIQGIARLQSMLAAVTSATANYTVISSDFAIRVSASGGPRAVTIPAASTHPGRILFIIKIDSTTNAVVITPVSGTISGSGSLTLATVNSKALLMADGGTDWMRIA